MNQLKIVLTGGGSGGHITPLIPLAHELKRQEPKTRLIYIGLKGERIGIIQDRLRVFDAVYRVSSGKFRRYHGEGLVAHLKDWRTILANSLDLLKVAIGTVQSWRLLGRLSSDVVFSKGGYVVVPVGLAARLRGIPIITHDSDAVGGLANRIVGRWAKIHATGQPADFYTYPESSIRQIGVPVDERIKLVNESTKDTLKKQIGMPTKSKVLLIAGGGHGSANLNNMILAIAKPLLLSDPNLRIIHVTGAQHQGTVATRYDSKLDPADRGRLEVFGWIADFYKYAGAADLIVTRAGATALAEFALAGKACIVVPSAFLSGAHQLKNAEVYLRQGAIKVVADNAPANDLLRLIKSLFRNSSQRQELAKKMLATARPKASKDLANLIITTAKKKSS